MRKVFQAELHQIREGMVEIAHLVTEAIEKASSAFENVDIELAQEVIARRCTD